MTLMTKPYMMAGRGFGIDRNDPSLVLFAPLWYPGLQQSLKSVDNQRHTLAPTGVVWSSSGGLFVADDRIDVNDNAEASLLNFTSGNYTIEFTIYLNALTADGQIINRCPANITAGWYVKIFSNGRLAIRHCQAGAVGQNYISTPGDITSGSFQRFAVRRNGATISMIKNGSTALTLTSNPGVVDPVSTAEATKIGLWRDNTTEGIENGIVQDITTYNRALSNAEVLHNYLMTKRG